MQTQNMPDEPEQPQPHDGLLRDYASGRISRRELVEQTGLHFSEILNGLGRLGLPLPQFDNRPLFNEQQRQLYQRIFGSDPDQSDAR